MLREPSSPGERVALGLSPFGMFGPAQTGIPTMGSPPLAPAAAPAPSPFVWGQGGAMVTPDQLAQRQSVAQSLMKTDYSPVHSVWEGLGRVADNVVGALQSRKLDRVAAALAKQQVDLGTAVQAGTPGAAEAAMIDPRSTDGMRTLAKLQYERMHPKPSTAEPYRWRDNAGNLQELGPDGKPRLVFVDPTQRYTIQGDQAVAVPNAFLPATGAAGAAPSAGMAVSPQPVGIASPSTLPADFDFADDDQPNGGATRHVSGGFPSR